MKLKSESMKKIITVALLLFIVLGSKAQDFSFAGTVGWASPQGGSFETTDDKKSSKGGLCIDADVLYHFNKFDNKLAAGITYNSSLLFGSSEVENLDIGIYTLSLYGVKGSYKFFDTGVTPFVNLSLGLSRFTAPEMTMNGEVIKEEESSSSFGVKPEVGVYLGGFIMSVGYMVPMKYDVVDETAGSLQFNIGYRYRLF